MVRIAPLVALVSALSVSANHVESLMTRSSVLARQITPAQVPSACSNSCDYPLQIYQACGSGDTATCTTVCGTSNYNALIGCLQCILDNSPGVTQGEVNALNSVVQQIEGACRQIGTVVAPQSFTVPASDSSTAPTASSISSLASSSSSNGASATSQPVTSSGLDSGNIPSRSSAFTSVASADSSRSAGTMKAVLPRGLEAALFALSGIAGGAVMVL